MRLRGAVCPVALQAVAHPVKKVGGQGRGGAMQPLGKCGGLTGEDMKARLRRHFFKRMNFLKNFFIVGEGKPAFDQFETVEQIALRKLAVFLIDHDLTLLFLKATIASKSYDIINSGLESLAFGRFGESQALTIGRGSGNSRPTAAHKGRFWFFTF